MTSALATAGISPEDLGHVHAHGTATDTDALMRAIFATIEKRWGSLLDRMAMQDQGAFKAMWATGIKIPRNPTTGAPVETFLKAIDRVFINDNPAGKYGQLEAEDIKRKLEQQGR